MTHPDTPEVGGEADSPATPADPFEAIAEDMLGEDQDAPDEQEPEADEAEAETDELDEDDLEDEPDLPAIEPPVSLTAEEKEAFKNLPREAQEFTARRIGELEKGFQTKAQEAASKERAAMKQAAEYIQQTNGEQAEVLDYYANLLVYPKPPARLAAENPGLYAQQLEAHEQSLAQRHEAQQRVQEYRAQQQHYQDLIKQHEAEQFHQRLTQDLPELLDPATGPALKAQLEATGRELGFTEQELFNATATEVLALKKIADLKAKADKYDALQRRKMERVRAGKNPPPVSRPGVARGAEHNRKAKADAAWEVVKSAKSRNVRDEAAATWLENSGFL